MIKKQVVMEQVKESINQILCEEFLSEKTNKYVSKNTIKMRLAQRLMNIMGISRIPNDFVYVHPDCSSTIEKVIRSLSFSNEEMNLIQNVLSRDYHEGGRLQKFSNMLKEKTNNDTEATHMLNIVFAVDGYEGSNYKSYTQHLKFNLKNEIENKDVLELHVKAIRHLYKKYGSSLNPETVFKAIYNAYAVIDETEMTKEYIDLVGLENLDVLKSIMEKRLKEEKK